MRRIDFRPGAVLVLLVLLVVASACAPQESPPQESIPQESSFVAAIPDAQNVQLTLIADGFDRPLFVTHAGDGSGRLFVVEQTGFIHIIKNGEVLEELFLDVSQIAHWLYGYDNMSGWSENGLLGMAFHPSYSENGYFFINYTDHEGDSVLERYRVSESDPNRADPESGQFILTVDQPDQVHNSGMLAFGPDGYLYVGLGDGGRGHSANGQQLDTLLGSILRMDIHVEEKAGYSIPPDNPFVDVKDAQPEIWAYGLRNPGASALTGLQATYG